MVRNARKKLNWKSSRVDTRDFLRVAAPLTQELPQKVSLGQGVPLYNQGSLGSCTANAIGTAVMIALLAQTGKYWVPSRLFVYYNEREMEGTIDKDAGAFIRDGFKSINKQGVCAESIWKYIPSNFAKKPPAKAYSEALLHKALKYHAVPNTLENIKQTLANGQAVVFGFNVYASFMSRNMEVTGIMPMPKKMEDWYGGHAVCAIGYDEARQAVQVRNSWGSGWGIKGDFWMPYAFITSLECDDFWCVELISP
jgi:C1A family cysteine protease